MARRPAQLARHAVDRASRSPLAVALALLLCLFTWSKAYRSSADVPPQGSIAPAPRAAVDVPIPPARTEARLSPTALPRQVPRLRTPFQPNGRPGAEIAVQDADGTSLRRLHDALARARDGQGQARLLFYGASHTAADIYTGYLRRALQNAYGDGGHGFVLPVQPWRGYSHDGVRIARISEDWTARRVGVPDVAHDHYGVAGVALDSSVAGASAFVETVRGDGLGSRASRFEIYYLRQPGGGHFEVLLDGQRTDRVSTNASSSSAGYAAVRAPDGAHHLELRVTGDGAVRVFGVAVERDTPGVIVDVHGINGSRARNQLYWDDVTFRDHLARRDPDLVALAYGTNESGDDNQPIAEYESLLRRVMRRIREAAPNASCLLIGPSDRPVEGPDGAWVDRPRTAQIIEAQWRVALESGCAFFDTVAFQGGAMSTVSWAAMEPPYAGRDHVHFTRLGYERMGQVLLGALLEGSSLAPPAPDFFDGDEPIQP